LINTVLKIITSVSFRVCSDKSRKSSEHATMSDILKMTSKLVRWHDHLILLRIQGFEEKCEKLITAFKNSGWTATGFLHSWNSQSLCQILIWQFCQLVVRCCVQRAAHSAARQVCKCCVFLFVSKRILANT